MLRGGAGDDTLSGDGNALPGAVGGDDQLWGDDGTDTVVGDGGRPSPPPFPAASSFAAATIGSTEVTAATWSSPATASSSSAAKTRSGGTAVTTISTGRRISRHSSWSAGTTSFRWTGNDFLDSDRLAAVGGDDKLWGDEGDHSLLAHGGDDSSTARAGWTRWTAVWASTSVAPERS
jgi:hemolysin type calcium-binding protein